MNDPKPRDTSNDDALLKELNDRRTYAEEEWRDIIDEGDTDILCVAGDPWTALDPEGAKARDKAKRPMLALDELGQYFNQVINDVRANPRAMKFSPTGNGANDKTAQFYADKAREIEYRSRSSIVYITALENALQRSYGYCRVKTKYESDYSFNQDLWLEAIPNPNLVLLDPDALSPDSSDMKYAFVKEAWQREEFLRRFPQAKVRNFDDYRSSHKHWVDGDKITLAEYWTIHTTERELLQFQLPNGTTSAVFKDDVARQPVGAKVVNRRPVQYPSVVQYLTNGVEILEETPWRGKYIPIVSCFGKVIYLDEGTGAKRKILSMTRLARDPYMLYCYIRTCEAEAISAVPRSSWIGYEGQFVHPEQWQKANHEPVAYLEAKPRVDGTGQDLLPLPQRQPWDPPLQNLEIAAEAARRSIQAAMGSNFLPTQAQRRNDKSGKALEKIEQASQRGTFHFVDHHNDMIQHVGVILEDLMGLTYDTAREVGIRKANEQAEIVPINDPSNPKAQSTQGSHLVTISTGQSFDSEREAASDFADTLVQTPLVAQVAGPQAAAKVLALAVKLKNLGPVGDQIADTISPPQPKEGDAPTPDQLQQALEQAKQQIAQMGQALQQAQQVIQTDRAKQVATLQKADHDGLVQVTLQRMKDATSIAVAKINALTKGVVSDNEAQLEQIALAHEQELAAHQSAHEVALGALQHQQGLEAGQQQADQASQLSDQGHQQALAQGQQAADLAPPLASNGSGA